MRFYFFLFSIFYFNLFSSQAQLLKPNVKWFGNEPYFNSEVIKANKIKLIKVEFLTKPDNEKMAYRNDLVFHEFDELGNLMFQYTVYKRAENKADTFVTAFEYYPDGNVMVKRSSDKFGYYSYNYAYDEVGNIIKEIYSRDINSNYSPFNFKLEKQYPIGEEKFDIKILTPTQYKQTLKNNLGYAYKEIIVNLNEKKKPIEEFGRYLVSGKIEKKTFEYNGKNQLIKFIDFKNVEAEYEKVVEYSYDKFDNYLEMKTYVNKEFIERSEFLNDSITGITNDIITRNEKHKKIDIVRFSYEYHPKPGEPIKTLLVDSVITTSKPKPTMSKPKRKKSRR